MRLKFAVAFAFALVGVCCLVLSALSANTAVRASATLRDVPLSAAAAVLQQDTLSRLHVEDSVLSSAHSNARLRLLADYTRTSADANEISDAASTPAPASPLDGSIPATVRPLPATPTLRRSTPAPPPPPPPTPRLSESPVIRFQNLESRASANLSVSDFVSNTFLATVFLGKTPEVSFHFEAASHVYQVSGTVQFEGATLPVETIVCTEFASVTLSVVHQTRRAEIRCDPSHSRPDSVTVINGTPEDAQISIVDGRTGSMMSQQILRQGMSMSIKEGTGDTVFVAYARVAGFNWRPAGCKYRGTVTISGSRTSDGGIKLSCDEQHRSQSTLRIINGSGECPVHASVFTAEKGGSALVPSKQLDDFNVNCGDTAESFIGHTDNSYRRIAVRMADGSTPSIVCPAGSTVLVGGSGLHC